MATARICLYCKAKLVKRDNEYQSDFGRRRSCNVACSNALKKIKYRERNRSKLGRPRNHSEEWERRLAQSSSVDQVHWPTCVDDPDAPEWEPIFRG